VRRLIKDLSDLGGPIKLKRVARLKQENDIYPKQDKRFIVTTDSKAIASNLLSRQFDVTQSDVIWVSDIIYIATTTGWVYLAVIIDFYLKHFTGWQLADYMKVKLLH